MSKLNFINEKRNNYSRKTQIIFFQCAFFKIDSAIRLFGYTFDIPFVLWPVRAGFFEVLFNKRGL